MKVLIVNTFDIQGGAARAAYRLHKAFLGQDVDSQMLVQDKVSDDFTVITGDTKLQRYFAKLRPILDTIPVRFYKNRTKTLFSPAYVPSLGLAEKINALNPDIVHLHWISGGLLRVEELQKIKAPIVWNLHDMWAFTGGCHYDEHCEGYKKSCGNCRVLKSDKANDLSKKVHNRKLKAYPGIKNLTVNGSSQWISQCAKESMLFKDKLVVNIPNCIDTHLFKQIDKNFVRDLFGIPKDKKVILFGAMNSLGDPRKGAKELFEAINLLDVDNTVFVIAGSSQPEQPLKLKYPVYFISPLHDEVSLPFMYNVADVMIVPSLQENLANSIVESLSCGVPVVAFDIGGNKDMIEHRENGYLAKMGDARDMAQGIEWVLANKEYDQLVFRARDKVLSTFKSSLVAKLYISLYQRILKQ